MPPLAVIAIALAGSGATPCLLAASSGAPATEPVAVIGSGAMLLLAGLFLRRGAACRSRVRARTPPACRPPSPEPTTPIGSVTLRDAATPWPTATVPVGDETLVQLARTLDLARRRRAAAECLECELAPLGGDDWLIERDVEVASGRIPWLVLGPMGVFALEATEGPWGLEALAGLAARAVEVRALLAGSSVMVDAAVVLAFDELPPRMWFAGAALGGRGAWVLGADWLLAWMFSFRPADGLARADVERLDAAAGPSLERCGSARLPAIRRTG